MPAPVRSSLRTSFALASAFALTALTALHCGSSDDAITFDSSGIAGVSGAAGTAGGLAGSGANAAGAASAAGNAGIGGKNAAAGTSANGGAAAEEIAGAGGDTAASGNGGNGPIEGGNAGAAGVAAEGGAAGAAEGGAAGSNEGTAGAAGANEAGAGGAGAGAGGAGQSGAGGTPSTACCVVDADCPGLPFQQICAEGVCKAPPLVPGGNGCWADSECSTMRPKCIAEKVCGCGEGGCNTQQDSRGTCVAGSCCAVDDDCEGNLVCRKPGGQGGYGRCSPGLTDGTCYLNADCKQGGSCSGSKTCLCGDGGCTPKLGKCGG